MSSKKIKFAEVENIGKSQNIISLITKPFNNYKK